MHGLSARWLWLAFWIGLCFAAAAIGSAFTTPQISAWYAGLSKPSWTPPNWVFGPVWTVLYLMMGVCVWLVWEKRNARNVSVAVMVFVTQLVLNTTWSIVFFGMQQPGWAVVNIITLWLAIGATIVTFWRHSRVAALMLLPYLLWVSYATTLNVGIWGMNS